MDNALSYIVYRFFFRIKEFLLNWYVRSSHSYWDRFFVLFARLDRFFALKITLKMIFRPLYGDYTFVGRVLGFIFRSLRIIVGLGTYLLIFALAAIVYIIWLLILPYLAISALGAF